MRIFSAYNFGLASSYLEYDWADTILAHARDDVDDEEWSPAEEKHAHDDPDGDRGLVLLEQGRIRYFGRLKSNRISYLDSFPSLFGTFFHSFLIPF
jgi:hypothetical protein